MGHVLSGALHLGQAGDELVTILRPQTPRTIDPTKACDVTPLGMVKSHMKFYLL